jgi:hypothetical protein
MFAAQSKSLLLRLLSLHGDRKFSKNKMVPYVLMRLLPMFSNVSSTSVTHKSVDFCVCK